jgi:hypothetical protein
MDDLSAFCCQNHPGPDYGRRGHGHLSVCARYGPHQRRLLDGQSGQARCSQRQGTPLFDARWPDDQAVAVRPHLAEGGGRRQTRRRCGVSKDSGARDGVRAGDHAQQRHDERVAFSPPHARGAGRGEMVLRRQEGQTRRSP